MTPTEEDEEQQETQLQQQTSDLISPTTVEAQPKKSCKEKSKKCKIQFVKKFCKFINSLIFFKVVSIIPIWGIIARKIIQVKNV